MKFLDHAYHTMNGEFGRSVISIVLGLVVIVVLVACVDGALGPRRRRRARSLEDNPTPIDGESDPPRPNNE